MGRKAKIGITRDSFGKDGKFIIPGPGLKSLDEMPNVEYEIFSEFLPEVTPEQIRGFDMVIRQQELVHCQLFFCHLFNEVNGTSACNPVVHSPCRARASPLTKDSLNINYLPSYFRLFKKQTVPLQVSK